MASCDNCEVGIANFNLLCHNDRELFDFLVSHGVLKSSLSCPKCGKECLLQWKRRMFVCGKLVSINKKKIRRCSFSQSIFKNSWFDRSKLSFVVVAQLTYYWLTLRVPRHQIILNELKITHHSLVDWSSFCREVCIDWATARSRPIGGPGVIVEIDEAKIGHRKYQRGRVIDGKWIFGGYDRVSKEIFLVPVPERNATTLISVIKEFILPGSTIYSDCWKAYNNLDKEGFQHLTVNHSLNFVDPDTGAHTQNIERVWREVRGNIPRFGSRDTHLVGYLAEFLFKRQYPNHNNRAHAFFRAVSQLYTP